jgi:steroid delta-isomerase-like uncharacterized protein
MSETVRTLARRFEEEMISRGDVPLADTLLAPDYAMYFSLPGVPQPLDREGYKQLLAGFLAAFPDARHDIDDVVVDGDRVAVRWTGRATHRGPLLGIPPTGRAIDITGTTVHRVRGDQIVESWETWDSLGLMQQLGVAPAPEPAAAGR